MVIVLAQISDHSVDRANIQTARSVAEPNIELLQPSVLIVRHGLTGGGGNKPGKLRQTATQRPVTSKMS